MQFTSNAKFYNREFLFSQTQLNISFTRRWSSVCRSAILRNFVLFFRNFKLIDFNFSKVLNKVFKLIESTCMFFWWGLQWILILTPEERLKSHQNHRKSFSYRVCIYKYLQINIFPLKVAIHKNMMLHLSKRNGKDKKKID